MKQKCFIGRRSFLFSGFSEQFLLLSELHTTGHAHIFNELSFRTTMTLSLESNSNCSTVTCPTLSRECFEHEHQGSKLMNLLARFDAS